MHSPLSPSPGRHRITIDVAIPRRQAYVEDQGLQRDASSHTMNPMTPLPSIDRPYPQLFSLYKGEYWMTLHRSFCEYVSKSPDNVARGLAAYFTGFRISDESYFQTVACHPEVCLCFGRAVGPLTLNVSTPIQRKRSMQTLPDIKEKGAVKCNRLFFVSGVLSDWRTFLSTRREGVDQLPQPIFVSPFCWLLSKPLCVCVFVFFWLRFPSLNPLKIL